MAAVPRRKDFAEGEEGRQAWKAHFNAYAGDFAYSHVATETVKGRMGAVGMWGDYCEREGHGKFVEWQRKESGTLKKIVVPEKNATLRRGQERLDSSRAPVERRISKSNFGIGGLFSYLEKYCLK